MVAGTLKISADSIKQAAEGMDRHVMIVGASRGVGEVTARLLGENLSCRLTLAARSYNRLIGLCMDLGNERAKAIRCDLSDEGSIDDCVISAVEHFGAPDALIITAGSHAVTPFSDASVKAQERFEAVLKVNLTGPYFMAQQVAARMGKGGAIIFLGNGRASGGLPGRHAHAAAKAGLVALARGMAKELGSRGIRVNVLEPGRIDTELGRSLVGQRAQAAGIPVEQMAKRLLASQPLRRMVQPEEVAQYLRFLIEPTGSAITGQVIDISCGGVMR